MIAVNYDDVARYQGVNGFADTLLTTFWRVTLNDFGRLLEAAGGFEPPYNGFADRRLTTWLSRLTISSKSMI